MTGLCNQKHSNNKTLYLSMNELRILTPITVNYPKGMEKMFGAFKTKAQAKKWGGQIIELEIKSTT